VCVCVFLQPRWLKELQLASEALTKSSMHLSDQQKTDEEVKRRHRLLNHVTKIQFQEVKHFKYKQIFALTAFFFCKDPPIPSKVGVYQNRVPSAVQQCHVRRDRSHERRFSFLLCHRSKIVKLKDLSAQVRTACKQLVLNMLANDPLLLLK